MALVSVKQVGSWGNIRADSCLSARVESLKLKIWGHEEIDKLGICSCSCTTGIDVGGDVMDFFAILLNYYRSSCSSGISSKYNSSVILDSDNSGSCFFIGKRFDNFFFFKHGVPEWVSPYLWEKAKSKPPICCA